MHQTLRGLDAGRLERSCAGDAIVLGAGAPGIERAAVRLMSGGFSRHRHDTYALGITTAGVQSFWYRGARRTCLPGQVHVLHPDEPHDGGPATAAGFAYRIVYVEPELVREALGGSAALPFVADPVCRPGPAARLVERVLREIEEPLGDLGRDAAAAALATALRIWSGDPGGEAGPIDLAACARVREHLAGNAREQTSSGELERIAGLDRFTLARQFRRAYGTSPDRYRTMRRLELARAAIAGGTPLAEAAAGAGFADQSHLTRQFRRAYGMTPGRFARCCASEARGATARTGLRPAAAGIGPSMTDPTQKNPRNRKERAREAERVARERKDDLPSQRDTESPESGRPPRQTQWERRGPTQPREY